MAFALAWGQPSLCRVGFPRACASHRKSSRQLYNLAGSLLHRYHMREAFKNNLINGNGFALESELRSTALCGTLKKNNIKKINFSRRKVHLLGSEICLSTENMSEGHKSFLSIGEGHSLTILAIRHSSTRKGNMMPPPRCQGHYQLY